MATDIVVPESVVKRLNDLPKEVRIKFWEHLERLINNPSRPSLRNEKLKGLTLWAFSITMSYRATYIRGEKSIIITAIGTHTEILG